MKLQTPSLKTSLGIFAALTASFFFLYRAWPDALRNFDGIIFSGIISETEPGWKDQMFMYAAHFLFNPFGWIFHKALDFLGNKSPGHVQVQIMNAAMGGLTVGVAFLFLLRMTEDAMAAVPLSLLMGVSFHFWTRAAECSVYMPSLFWTLIAVGSAWEYQRSRNKIWLAALASSGGIATLFHLQHGFWMPIAALLVFWVKPKDLFLFFALWGLFGWIPQMVTFNVYTPAQFKSWLINEGRVGVTAWGIAEHSKLILYTDFVLFAKNTFKTLWNWPVPWNRPAEAAALVLSTLALAGAMGRSFFSGDKPWRRDVKFHVFGALFFLSVIFLQVVVARGEDPKFTQLIFPFIFSVALLLKPNQGKTPSSTRAALALACAGTFYYNAAAGIIPQSRVENNPALGMANFVAENTEPNSAILMSGWTFNMAKVYLPALHRRARISMDLYLIPHPKEKALPMILDAEKQFSQAGFALYTLGEVADGRILDSVYKVWNLNKGDIDFLLGNYVQIEKAKSPDYPGLSVIRLWPKYATNEYWKFMASRAMSFKNWPDAVYALEKLIRQNPAPDLQSLQNLGYGYLKLGSPQEAEEVWKTTLTRFPQDESTLLLWSSEVLRKKGDGPALSLLKKWAPGRADALFQNLKSSNPSL